MLNSPVVTLNSDAGIFLLNLPAFSGGPSAAVERIPSETAGIYAWYRYFEYPDAPQSFYETLLLDVERKKFLDRGALVPPQYQITIASHSSLSERKKDALKAALTDDSFRAELRQALSYGILFQTPLYIGKSKDLRKRTLQHLEPESPLRQRLQEVGIDLRRCILLFVPTGTGASGPDTTNSEETAIESLYEEIFSRLFNPHFSIKYG